MDNNRYAIPKVSHGSDGLWDKRQLASYLKVSVYAIDSWVSQRKIPFVKVGSLVRFVPEAIREWLKKGGHRDDPNRRR